MGVLFLYFAIQRANEIGTIWNWQTLIFAGVATLDFGLSIKFIRIHLHHKNNKKE